MLLYQECDSVGVSRMEETDCAAGSIVCLSLSDGGNNTCIAFWSIGHSKKPWPVFLEYLRAESILLPLTQHQGGVCWFVSKYVFHLPFSSVINVLEKPGDDLIVANWVIIGLSLLQHPRKYTMYIIIKKC